MYSVIRCSVSTPYNWRLFGSSTTIKWVWACQYIAYDYLAHWLWYWVTIPKVQGSNLSLTTNLWPSFGLCSVVQPQFSSKFPALALNRPGTLVPIPPASQGISKLAYIARWRCTLNVKVANLEVDRFTQKLLTLVHRSLITTYHKEHRLRMLLGVVRDISQGETCSWVGLGP